MTQKSRGRPSRAGLSPSETKDVLIRRALELWTEKGFAATGLNELLGSVNVPKGSFYHYFDSKESFGECVIESYADFLSRKLARHFSCENKAPLSRLEGFIDEASEGLGRYEYRRGCLIGNLGQELGGLDAALRQQLSDVFVRWGLQLKELLDEAVDLGEIPLGVDTATLSSFFWMGWEGAILSARLERSPEPLMLFKEHYLRLCHCQTITLEEQRG